MLHLGMGKHHIGHALERAYKAGDVEQQTISIVVVKPKSCNP